MQKKYADALIIFAILVCLFVDSGWKWPLIIMFVLALYALHKDDSCGKKQASQPKMTVRQKEPKISPIRNNKQPGLSAMMKRDDVMMKNVETVERDDVMVKNVETVERGDDDYEISYERDGEEIVRWIKPKAISCDGHCLDAYCFLRKENRTFNFSKIKWMKDCRGKEIDSPKIFFHKKFKQPFSASEYADIDFGVNKFELPDDILSSRENLRLNIEADYFERTGENVRYKMTVNCIRTSSFSDEYYVKCEFENGESRNLSTNKLTNIVNTDSGELIENLAKTIFEIYQTSPEGYYKKFVKNFSDELNVLNFIGRADGSLAQREKDVIFQYFSNFEIAGLDKSFIDKAFRGLKTDMPDLKKSLRNLKNKENFNSKLFIDCAKGIVACGKATALELAAIGEVEKNFAQI